MKRENRREVILSGCQQVAGEPERWVGGPREDLVSSKDGRALPLVSSQVCKPDDNGKLLHEQNKNKKNKNKIKSRRKIKEKPNK